MIDGFIHTFNSLLQYFIEALKYFRITILCSFLPRVTFNHRLNTIVTNFARAIFDIIGSRIFTISIPFRPINLPIIYSLELKNSIRFPRSYIVQWLRRLLAPYHVSNFEMVLRLLAGVVLPAVPAMAVFGNALVIFAILREKSLQSVTNLLIVSLAVSDLLVSYFFAIIFSYCDIIIIETRRDFFFDILKSNYFANANLSKLSFQYCYETS